MIRLEIKRDVGDKIQCGWATPRGFEAEFACCIQEENHGGSHTTHYDPPHMRRALDSREWLSYEEWNQAIEDYLREEAYANSELEVEHGN
jgi:hypothetical protein